MRVSVRAGGGRAASVTVVRVELDKGPGPEMDVGRGVRAGLGAIALELIVGHGPVSPALPFPLLPAEREELPRGTPWRGRSPPLVRPATSTARLAWAIETDRRAP